MTLPAPAPGAAASRPRHSYDYSSATETRVHAAGIDESATGFARKVSFDASRRWLTDSDATGRQISATWAAGDQQLTSTDAAGRVTKTDWDPEGRPVATWGPAPGAPGSCQGSGGASNGSCPHTTTTYDGGLVGLAATWWANSSWAGAPKLHSTGVGRADGALQDNWSAGPPDPDLGASWSARFTGEVTLASASNLAVSGGSATLLVDDAVISATTSVAAGLHRIEIDYTPASNATIELDRRPAGGGSFTLLAGSALGPRYGLVTRTVSEDTTPGSPSVVTATAYGGAGAPDPATGLATSVTSDPGDATHANLTTAFAYESGGLLRLRSRTLPAGNATGYDYYGDTDAPANPCGGPAANQSGHPRLTTAPSPDGGPTPGRTTEWYYDGAGRVVATRHNADPWTCLAYDARGRLTSEAVPALGAPFNTPARTVTRAYATGLNNDPRGSTVSDPVGTVTTTVDLLGRVVSYSDVWGNNSTSAYDPAGRLSDTSGRDGARHADYDPAGRLTAQRLDGATVATATYNPAGELASVAYGNGTALASITRDAAGRTTGLSFNQAGGSSLLTDTVGRSQGGRVTSETVDATAGSTFSYDTAGRLSGASLPGHSLAYSFGDSGCGSLPNAGRNTNRTSVTDNGATPTTYCYDRADRVISSSDPGVGSPSYDPHGNTRTLGAQTLAYDGSDRHMGTTTASASVTYARDGTDRIVSRTEGGATLRYGYSGPGDPSSFTTDGLGLGVQDRTISLIGGVLLTKRGTGDVWSYPNVHGDLVVTADPQGAKRDSTIAYDPFGTTLTATSPTAPDGVPDNSGGNFDYGWLGSHQRGLEHAPGTATIEMGQRSYAPALGRFLQVDPVEGGSANDYEYVNGDPVNGLDLDGLKPKYVIPDSVKRMCGPGASYTDSKTDTCSRYRLSVATGRGELFFHPERLNDESNNPFDSYFATCVKGAAPSAAIGALGGPAASGLGAAEGCAGSLAKRGIRNTHLSRGTKRALSYGIDAAGTASNAANLARYGRSAFRQLVQQFG